MCDMDNVVDSISPRDEPRSTAKPKAAALSHSVLECTMMMSKYLACCIQNNTVLLQVGASFQDKLSDIPFVEKAQVLAFAFGTGDNPHGLNSFLQLLFFGVANRKNRV